MSTNSSSIFFYIWFYNHNLFLLHTSYTTFCLCHNSGSFLETRGTSTGKSPSYRQLVLLCRLWSWANPESEGSLTVIFGVNFFTIFGGDPCAKNPHRYPLLSHFHLRKSNHRVIIQLSRKNYKPVEQWKRFQQLTKYLMCLVFSICKGFLRYINAYGTY